jgi:Fe2+ transport system protein FeoA
MRKKLSEFKIGDSGIVKAIDCEPIVRRRLNDMGVFPGVEVKLVRFAPMGDPMQIEIRGYMLALRKNEASNITMEVK